MATGTAAEEAVDAVRHLWAPERPFLDTASFGLPPRPAFDALQRALGEWRGGRTTWEGWAGCTDGARAAFAALVGVPVERVAIGSTVSEMVGLVAAALPDGSHVVAPENDFTSLLFPWMVHAGRGVRVTLAPVHELAAAVARARPDVVAFSTVQSATGEVADVDAVVDAARACGALVVADATQACGWLPTDGGQFDALACGAYKWLMAPRGSAFLAVGEALQERLTPLAAGWFASEDVYSSYYGAPLRLAASARRLDTSPAWFSWVGTTPALELLLSVGVDAVHRHDVALADRFRAGLGMAASDSAIVSVQVPDAASRLEAAGVRAAVRGGHLRASFHLYNTTDDVDAALDALCP
ncbi:MAG TPA: aminotransferase class V-fold PLP-dependent enzyme [Acidimicrobiales bacterium]|nr:aminotransferase class V-fold PLP-dependent enzyme [Acidimicrobiales bacterium]